MENPYIKQYPDLMSGKKVMYVHGFMSSAQSGTVKLLQDCMPNAQVIAEDLPLHPEEAMQLLKNLCDTEKPDLIIGSSMGGMFTEMLYGYDRILTNPAFRMGDTMSSSTGKQVFQNPRKDGVQEFMVTKGLIKEYKDITEHCFEGITPEEQRHVWGLFGDEDTTVNTYDLFHAHYNTAIRFHGEHRMNDNSFMHAVIPVIRWIDDQQEGRERPIVYIDVNTLIEKWQGVGEPISRMKPQSSSQKAVRLLLENYQLFFVSPAPVESPYYTEINQWLYQYINVPAYGHTVFTNQKHLLYGDYLIDAEKTEGMATLIQFGSDTFKTWDHIIDFFTRLKGQ